MKVIKEMIQSTFMSVRKKINAEERKYCFEIFGFDFLIDEEFSIWLIEVNTNPCIELSSPILKQLVPRMLDDAFKLTIDTLFGSKSTCSEYPVDNYDEKNMWEYLLTLQSDNRLGL